jgi:hypothetical protein
MSEDRRDIATLLLITQSGLALLAALGLHSYVKLSNVAASMVLPEFLAFGGPLILLALAIGILKNAKPAKYGVYAWEAFTMLGTLFSILASGGNSSLLLTSGLTGLALPATIMYCLSRGSITMKDLTTALLLVTALIHLTLVPEHLSEAPTLGRLFLLDALGFLVMAYFSRKQTNWWRSPAAALLLATILAYLVVVLKRQESVDDLGIATKFIELLALGMVLWPGSIPAPRWRSLFAATALVGSIVTSGGLAWAATLLPGSEVGHSHAHVLEGKTLIAEGAPTDAQKSAASKLVEETRNGIARFDDIQVAVADG